MQSQKKYIPNELLIAIGILIFELAYFTFLSNWLNQWFVFRAHLPTLVIFSGMFAGLAVSYYEYRGIGPQEGIVRRGTNGLEIALTFDDGPNPEYTNEILDVLKKKQVKAAFFMVGKHVEKYPEVAKRVFNEGHDIGNHTYSHRDLVSATRKTIIKEIDQTDKAMMRVLGIKTKLFRPPRGMFSNSVRKLIIEMGYTIILWTDSAKDWRGSTPKTIVRRVTRHIKSGGVILFHDSGSLIRSEGADRGNTVAALPLVIDEIRRKGYKIVALSQMLNELDHIEEERFIEVLLPPSAAAGQEI
ncbi:MAG TPA: polysaccharide deacetylase family protein [Actinobacteria bacterium]|nr:polysaccharide deacetylase family protein [Actinomycetota bacterium]